MKRVGLLSGTFDPIHVGHVEVCLVAKAACELDEVLVFVENSPTRKQNIAEYKDRLEMVKLALYDFQTIKVIDNGLNNITLKSIQPFLEQHYPNTEFVLIIGADMLKHLPDWNDIDEILKQMKLCVFMRDKNKQKKIEKNLNQLSKKYNLTFNLLPPVWSEVSSSIIKKDIQKNGTTDLVHRNVLKYIKDKKLYSSSFTSK